jgi:hypothetical protein
MVRLAYKRELKSSLETKSRLVCRQSTKDSQVREHEAKDVERKMFISPELVKQGSDADRGQ